MGSLITTALPVIAKSNSERILKTGQHLPKLWAKIKCPVFLLTGSGKIGPVCNNTVSV